MDTNEGKVFLIDDDADVRGGISRLLRSAGWDVECFGNAESFLTQAPSNGVGCILLDVSMPGMTGPELHDELQKRGNDIPVVYLTGHGNVPTCVAAMKHGAFDFLEKPVDETALLQDVEAAIAARAAACVAQQQLDDLRTRLSRLSPREREVMSLVIRGLLNKQIAGDMDITVKTVKVHRGRMMKKMGVRSVAQLVRVCDRLGLSPAPASPPRD